MLLQRLFRVQVLYPRNWYFTNLDYMRSSGEDGLQVFAIPHGSPWHECKVVLNQELLKDGIQHNVEVTACNSFRSKFKKALRSETQLARQVKQALLIFIIGHGDYNSKGTFVGPSKKKDWFTMEDFWKSVGDGICITLITNVCFSGNWSVNLDRNIGRFTAAGLKVESQFWTASTVDRAPEVGDGLSGNRDTSWFSSRSVPECRSHITKSVFVSS